MAADPAEWPIYPKHSSDKRGVRHVGGQLGETDRRKEGRGEEESNRLASVTLMGGRVIQMSGCCNVFWLRLGRLHEMTDRMTF